MGGAKPWRNLVRRVPTILQMEVTECGAACLAMVLAYHKLFVPLERLRHLCGVCRDGSNALHLVRAARHLGMDARGFKCEPGDLGLYQLPLVIHWEFNHFVVLEGRKGNIYSLNDPGFGRRRVSSEEFDRSFTGLVLQITPGANFQAGGARRSLWMALWRRFGDAKTTIAYIFFCSLLLIVPGIIIPSASMIFVDEVLGSNPGWLPSLTLALGLTILVKCYLVWLRRVAVFKLGMRYIVSSGATLFNHVVRLPMEFYGQRTAGDIEYRLTLNKHLADLLGGHVGEILPDMFMAMFFLLVMFQYDTPLATAGAAIAAFNLGALALVNRGRQNLNQSLTKDRCQAAGILVGGIQGIETIKASATDFDFFGKWSNSHVKVVDCEQRMEYSSLRLSALPESLGELGQAAILVFGAWRVMDGDMTMGMLVAFQSLMAAFLAPVGSLVNIGAQLQEAKGATERLDDILDYPPAPAFSRAAPAPAASAPAPAASAPAPAASAPAPAASAPAAILELRNIVFGYAPLGEPLVKDFNLRIEPGRRVAVVGRSGSGKSTIAKIAGGLRRPWSGEVLLNGRPIEEVPREEIESTLAIVDQDIVMFSGSVRDNLGMWNPLLDDNDMMAAASAAAIHSEVSARIGGYAAQLSEDGRNFSGGQRQRMEIARALVNQPACLILDEATSALDPETEQTIDANLRRRQCAALIVAHRLSTIRDCDEILVMEDGAIVQRGTHEDMIKSPDSPYAKLIKAE